MGCFSVPISDTFIRLMKEAENVNESGLIGDSVVLICTNTLPFVQKYARIWNCGACGLPLGLFEFS